MLIIYLERIENMILHDIPTRPAGGRVQSGDNATENLRKVI
jgi:hypothetical protein